MHSIKTKLLWSFTAVVIIALTVSGGILIWQNTKAMQRDIFLDALSFAELTNNSIVTSFEQFYLTQQFLQFRKEVNPLLSKNTDIDQIQVIGKSGELFYDSIEEVDAPFEGESRRNTHDIDRVRSLKPSLLFRNGMTVYAKKSVEGEWIAVDENEELSAFPSGEVVNLIAPHSNFQLDVVYRLNYSALWGRITAMVVSIGAVMLLGIVLTMIVAAGIAKRLVRPLKKLEEGVIQIGKGAYGTTVDIQSHDEIEVLAHHFNEMSTTLKKNTDELVEKEKLTHELGLAKNIQEHMLPKKSPDHPALDIAGSVTPASFVGGDIFDYIPAKENDLFIFIADVTGHGVPAGIIASVTQACLYSYTHLFEKTDEILKAMNRVIRAKSTPGVFATSLLVRWNQQVKKMKFCNAGHEQMLLHESKTNTLRYLGKGGMALGMTDAIDALLHEQEFDFGPEDTLILYTDGIPEAWKNEKENLGNDGLLEMAREVLRRSNTAESVRKNLLDAVNVYRHGFEQKDDITLVVIRGK